MLSLPPILLAAGVAWVFFALVCRGLDRTLSDDPIRNLALLLIRVYSRMVHRVRVFGLEHVPRWRWGDAPVGPLVVVSNHASGADPLLIQSACGFEIRWMMMRNMMPETLAGLWRWIDVIPVERNGRDSSALRTAIRHLQAGGVVGIFAEGGLERPPGIVKPFEPGVGLIVQKTGARVLPVVIDGTPTSASAARTLITPSHTRVRFLPMRSYAKNGPDPAGIALDLEKLVAETLGWPRQSERTG
jgi:1-acyl-sn-glycerol-3-phosphate acyltransferase